MAKTAPDTKFESHRDLLTRLEGVRHCGNNGCPLFLLDPELALCRRGSPVELGAAAIFRLGQDGAQPAGLFHSVQSWKKRSRFHLKCSMSNLLDSAGNPQAVKFSLPDSLQNQQVERALKKIYLALLHAKLPPINLLYENIPFL